MQPETHVVTVGLQFSDGIHPDGFVCEIFRGDEQECKNFVSRMPGVSHDQRPIAQATITLGRIEEWEQWLRT
jgi:hypothetical protein